MCSMQNTLIYYFHNPFSQYNSKARSFSSFRKLSGEIFAESICEDRYKSIFWMLFTNLIFKYIHIYAVDSILLT